MAKHRCSASGQEIYQQPGGRLTLDLWQTALGTHHGFDPYAELERQTGVRLFRERWMEHVRAGHWSRWTAQRAHTSPHPMLCRRAADRTTLWISAVAKAT